MWYDEKLSEKTSSLKAYMCVCVHTHVFQYMEEFAELLVPVTDPRHKVVEQVVQHLAQRNKDIPEMSDVIWSVHVVQSPNINAFVLPVSKTQQEFLYLLMLSQ